MDQYSFILEIISLLIILVLIIDVAIANRGYRKLKSKDEKSQEELEKQRLRSEDLEKRVVFLEKQLWGENSVAYEKIKSDPNMNDAEKQAALHKLYMDHYAEANR